MPLPKIYDPEKLAKMLITPRTAVEIAAYFGVEPETVRAWKARPETTQALEKLILGDARNKVLMMTDSALKALQKAINLGNVKAVQLQLEMAGLLSKAQEVAGSGKLVVVVPQGIQVPEAKPTIDVEPTGVRDAD